MSPTLLEVELDKQSCVGHVLNWNLILSRHPCFPAVLSPTLQVYVKDSEGPVSPFHDIPLRAGDNTFHAVIEIPR